MSIRTIHIYREYFYPSLEIHMLILNNVKIIYPGINTVYRQHGLEMIILLTQTLDIQLPNWLSL